MPSTPSATANNSAALHAQTFDLWGSRLIEASAGTGKTWTIAALYLRLVLGHGGTHGFERPLRPDEILVMTFTRAATRELSDRIRARLLLAAQWFRGQQPADATDPFLESLLADYPAGRARDHAAWLLSLAAEGMDGAAVHTIDAWCQRMLKEHAFDSGCLFDEELVADEEAMRLEAAQDYWRQSCYPLTLDQLTQVLDVWRNVEELAKDMKDLLAQDIAPQPGAGSLEQVLSQSVSERKLALDHIKSGWAQRALTMQAWLDAQLATPNHGWNASKLRPTNYKKWLNALAAWADGTQDAEVPDLKTGWRRLTPNGMQDARAVGAPPITLPEEYAAFAQLSLTLDNLPTVKEALRRHAAGQIAQRLMQLKRQSGSFGFADMQARLNTALASDNGAR
ncbi:MAG: UvrD-helicase domain-containing protein, partial [Rhodoferax sp.]